MIDRSRTSPAAWWTACQTSLSFSEERRTKRNYRYYVEVATIFLLLVLAFVVIVWTVATVTDGFGSSIT
jgi:pilus assembly protein TadC